MTTVAALPSPLVESFFHAPTNTFTHVVYDQRGGHAAIIDPVMDFDPASGRTGYTSVQAVIASTKPSAIRRCRTASPKRATISAHAASGTTSRTPRSVRIST